MKRKRGGDEEEHDRGCGARAPQQPWTRDKGRAEREKAATERRRGEAAGDGGRWWRRAPESTLLLLRRSCCACSGLTKRSIGASLRGAASGLLLGLGESLSSFINTCPRHEQRTRIASSCPRAHCSRLRLRDTARGSLSCSPARRSDVKGGTTTRARQVARSGEVDMARRKTTEKDARDAESQCTTLRCSTAAP